MPSTFVAELLEVGPGLLRCARNDDVDLDHVIASQRRSNPGPHMKLARLTRIGKNGA